MMEADWWSARKGLDIQRDRNTKSDITLLPFLLVFIELGVKVSWTVASRHGVVIRYRYGAASGALILMNNKKNYRTQLKKDKIFESSKIVSVVRTHVRSHVRTISHAGSYYSATF